MKDNTNRIQGLSDKDAEEALLAFHSECHGEECSDSLKAALFRVRVLRNHIRHNSAALRAILNKEPGYCTRCGMRYWISEERSGDLEAETLKHEKQCPRWDLVSSESEAEPNASKKAIEEDAKGDLEENPEGNPGTKEKTDSADAADSADSKIISDKDLEEYIRSFYSGWHEKECDDIIAAAIFYIRRLDAICWNDDLRLMSVLNKKSGYCLDCGYRFWAGPGGHFKDFESALRDHEEGHRLNEKMREGEAK